VSLFDHVTAPLMDGGHALSARDPAATDERLTFMHDLDHLTADEILSHTHHEEPA